MYGAQNTYRRIKHIRQKRNCNCADPAAWAHLSCCALRSTAFHLIGRPSSCLWLPLQSPRVPRCWRHSCHCMISCDFQRRISSCCSPVPALPVQMPGVDQQKHWDKKKPPPAPQDKSCLFLVGGGEWRSTERTNTQQIRGMGRGTSGHYRLRRK